MRSNFDTTLDGLDTLVNSTVDAYCDFYLYLRFQVDAKCGTKIVGLEFNKNDWAWALNPAVSALIKDPLNTAIINATEARIFSELYSAYFEDDSKQPVCKLDDNRITAGTPVLDMHTFYPLFVFMFGAGVFALVGFGLEKCVGRMMGVKSHHVDEVNDRHARKRAFREARMVQSKQAESLY